VPVSRNVQRLTAFRALWRALAQGRRPGSPDLGERLGALPRMLPASVSGRYRGLSRGRMALFAIALAYLLSPVDVLPELVLNVFGLGDDAVVALWLAGAFLVESERYLRWEHTPRADLRATG
jgi:uncharacterized membrane protein YkvA (DUF1232 family)